MTSAPTLRHFADALDARDWEALRTLLAHDFRGEFVHDGRRFDADTFVAFQRDYPGRWRFEMVEQVVANDRVVARSRVSDGDQVFWVATFATLDDGLISDLVEVWTEAVGGPGAAGGPEGAARPWGDEAGVGQAGGAKNSRAIPSGSLNETPDP